MEHRYGRSLAVTMGMLIGLASARADAADEDTGPTPVLLGLGLAVAAGGATVAYTSARHYVDHPDASAGWVALNGLGLLTMEGGGALVALWGWKLGEHAYATDVAGGVPIRSRRPLALTGVAIGAVALVAIEGASFYVFSKISGCANPESTINQSQHCLLDNLVTLTVVQIAAGGVLLVAAPLAGYGFGYDSTARRAGKLPSALRYVVAPTFVATADGRAAPALGLVGRF